MAQSAHHASLVFFLLAIAALLAPASVLAEQGQGQTRLVVLVTIDGLRGDVLPRFTARFGEGGFRRLMDRGAHYTNAHYQHATTLTATGHASLATGGNVAEHGIAGNNWHDAGQRVYCVEDDRHAIIGSEPKRHRGASPRNLTSSAFGDQLVLATEGRSRVFSVSLKDRAAILPAGHRGKAFWYAADTGQFVTSTYYYEKYPQWVQRWNAAQYANRYRKKKWGLLHEASSYLHASQDDRPWESPPRILGRTFPHRLSNPRYPTDRRFYSVLRYTPVADTLTLHFAKALLEQERLGQGEAADVLAISFSATDHIGHVFGPNSLEAEDNLLRLDRTLADLFSFIDESVGLDHTLIVLSSDHGMAAIPEYQSSLGEEAGRHLVEDLLGRGNAALKARFSINEDLIIAFWSPSLYLDIDAIALLGLNVATVEQVLAEAIRKIPGFALAVTRTALLQGDLGGEVLLDKVQKSFHPQRSGNVLVVQDSNWNLHSRDHPLAAMHGSPWTHDTHVPILFAGPGIDHAVIDRPVGPEDIASTITAWLGIEPPSGSTGSPLVEVLQNR